MKKWRTARKCSDCPFATKGPGLELRKSLRPARWREILDSLRRDAHFFCHKTTEATGDGSNQVCAGSIEWQTKHGVTSQYVRICKRLDVIHRRKL